ncbi:hypothetical protein SPAB_01794 [Salmonella enterica subsp. enterica serovar Paratyphi B str. SPB7]|uniref:Uncharacterized protein n=1 Tax=Salmonella paratyphi B (strain ATCC BAA-1250 / SPB7) TaxID=1016998 RepID=A0A6C6Z1G3_SALPB|nr:hypothetical protein SPAB_01794 [Salmonella enterica subsp. enterica serovar Paratyphi B str. SPB7]
MTISCCSNLIVYFSVTETNEICSFFSSMAYLFYDIVSE